MDRLLVRILVTATSASLLVAVLIVLTRLGSPDSADVPFDQIQCPAPPGMTRAAFLAEVQYLAALPDHGPFSEDQLQTAFAAHPWVESVNAVHRGPPVQIVLTYRRPVLRVGQRCVDPHGVILPPTSVCATLELSGTWPEPRQPAGQTWNDARIQEAAQLADSLHNLNPAPLQLHDSPQGWVIVFPQNRRIRWGPYNPHDSDARSRLHRLRAYLRTHFPPSGDTMDQWDSGALFSDG